MQKPRDKVTVTGPSSGRRSCSVGTLPIRKVPAGAQQNVSPDIFLSSPAFAPSKVLVSAGNRQKIATPAMNAPVRDRIQNALTEPMLDLLRHAPLR